MFQEKREKGCTEAEYKVLRDHYAMNRETGEIIPCAEAIALFYSQPGRGCLDDWMVDYIETDLEVEDDYYLTAPDFYGVVTV